MLFITSDKLAVVKATKTNSKQAFRTVWRDKDRL